MLLRGKQVLKCLSVSRVLERELVDHSPVRPYVESTEMIVLIY